MRYNLPNGETTGNKIHYIREWKRLGRAAARNLSRDGVKAEVIGFDPGFLFSFHTKDRSYIRSLTLCSPDAITIAGLKKS